MKSVLRDLRRIPESVRWKDPLVVVLLLMRKIAHPLIYWDIFDIFETDLRLPLPESYAKRKFDVRIYGGTESLKRAVEDLTSLKVLPADIELRLGRGDVVAVAYEAHEVVGCMWLSFSTGRALALGTRWIINSREAVRYGSFVRPDRRGNAIYSLLNNAVNRYARECGAIRTLGAISVLNSQSMRLAKHFRKVRTMRVVILQLRGVEWIYRKAIGAPLDSRFASAQDFPTRSRRSQFFENAHLERIINLFAHLLPFQAHRRK
jgi:hypothetical protein